MALAYGIAAVGKTTGADRSRAVELLEKAVRESPDDAEVLLFLAEIYRTDGKNALARPLYERAIALDPGQVTGSVGLGGVMMERGEYQEAIRLWTDALAKNAGLELVRLNLAVALLRVGRVEEAKTHLKKALDLNPAFAPAVEMQEKIAHLAAR
ncbi:MAG: tetratricopeptide repeat protein [Ignavibacteriota bacterium]